MGFGLGRFLTNSGRALQLAGCAVISLEGSNRDQIPSPDPRLRIPYIAKIPSIFMSVFKPQKTRKAAPKASKKRHKSIPEFIKNDFHEKRFLQYLQCENLDLEVPSVEISIQKSITNDLETSPKTK